MSYELAFMPQALKEWKKLDPHTRQLFKTRLIERLEAPRVVSAQLRGTPTVTKSNCGPWGIAWFMKCETKKCWSSSWPLDGVTAIRCTLPPMDGMARCIDAAQPRGASMARNTPSLSRTWWTMAAKV